MTTRIVFMGTPEFALVSLKILVQNSAYQVVCVYTQPPRPSGRGHPMTPSPVQMYAESQGIEVRTPITLKTPEEQEKFKSLNPDVAIVAAYGLILPKAILDTPRRGCLNIHASLLPRWRGAAPIQRSIEAGDSKTGVSLMQMDVGLDTGPTIAMIDTPITSQTTGKTLHDTLAVLGAELLMKTLPAYLEGTTHCVPQPLDDVTYAHKLDKAEGLLAWTQDAETLLRKLKAFTPFPGVWFFHQGIRIKVIEAIILPSTSAKPGTILNEHLHIACGKGIFCPTILQKEGGKPLLVEDFLRGFPIHASF